MGALFRKEVLAHLLSYRAPLAFALVLCLTVGGALVFRADHRARLDAFNRAEALRMDALSRQCESQMPLAAALSQGDAYCDPWKQPYGILLDLNMDDRITGTKYGAGDIRAKVGVYSLGETGEATTDNPQYKTW